MRLSLDCTGPGQSSTRMQTRSSSQPSTSSCHCQSLVSAVAAVLAPGLDPGIWEIRTLPGSFLPELMALSGSLPERHFASLQLIAIQSRQSSPQDPNAIFSLNYAKSFREGGEII